MPRPLDPADLPEDIARIALAQVAAGNFESVEDVVRASAQALEAREDEFLDYARDLWRERKAAAERWRVQRRNSRRDNGPHSRAR